MNKHEIDEFRSAALEFEATGKYCKHDPNTISGKKFWIEQARRSVKGYHIGSDYISGYNYFYLNFSPIKKAKTDGDDTKARVRGSLSFDFPDWWDFDKLYFDYLEEAEAAGEHASVLKSRRKGYSFKGGSMCNRNYFLIPRSTSYVYASDKAYLIGDGGILSKAWDIMSFVDENTPWVKRRQASDTGLQKRSSYKVMENGTYIEKGFKSEIVGITIGGDWNRVRGKQAKLILWEEAGTNPYLLKAYNAALPSLKQGNIVYGLSVSFGCVCAGTKVWTGNGKWVNIEDVKLGDTLLGYNGVSTSIEPITYIQPEGYKECIRIETSKNRYLECSHDHPLLVKSKIINTGKKTTIVTFKKAEELVTGDRIMISNNIGHFGEKEMWQPELIGLLIGDGNYSINESPSLSISSESLYSFLESKDLSINISKIKKSSTGVYAQIYFRGIIDKLKDLGIYGQVKDKKTLPINIEQYDEESIRKLLSGYFEADGNVQVINNRRVVKLTCKYKEILEDVQQLLLKLGINSAIRKEKKGSEVLTSIVNNKKYETKEFFAHVLYITDSFYIKRFKEKIGFLSKEKQSRLDSFVDNFYREANVYPNGVLFRKNPSNNKGEYFTSLDRLYGLEGVKVTKVSNIGIKRIYNLTANNTHTYITNGFVSANTGGSEGQDFMGLEELFFNPKGHEIHPMKNIWEDDELGGYCGFFHPEWANMDGYMDECGNSKKIEAIAAWEKELANIKEHARNPDAVVRFLAEHPIKPSQALLQSKHNEFPVIEIKKTLAKLMSSEQMQDAEFIGEFELDEVSGKYKWKPNPDLTPIKVFPLDLTGDNNAISIEGCWVIYEHPILDENNQVTWGRYIAGTDPVDDDRDDSLESESIQSTFVLDTWTDRIVAEYSGRPYNVETYYENLRRGLLYYNATCNYEQEKKGLYTYFKNKNSLHLLADNLEILSDRGISMFKGEGNRSKGTMGTHPVQKHGRDLIKTYLVNVSPGTEEVLNVHRIRSIPLLKELMYWNPEGNFDRVSALSMLMLYRAEKYRQVSERKVLVKSKLENSRILERNKVNSYGNFHKINQLFHKVTN